jgi:hypothetical protein
MDLRGAANGRERGRPMRAEAAIDPHPLLSPPLPTVTGHDRNRGSAGGRVRRSGAPGRARHPADHVAAGDTHY